MRLISSCFNYDDDSVIHFSAGLLPANEASDECAAPNSNQRCLLLTGRKNRMLGNKHPVWFKIVSLNSGNAQATHQFHQPGNEGIVG